VFFRATRRIHCAANINHTASFIAGGEADGRYLDDAYVLHWRPQRWVRLPNTSRRRIGISCSLFTDAAHNAHKQHILVVGGKHIKHIIWEDTAVLARAIISCHGAASSIPPSDLPTLSVVGKGEVAISIKH
jgi:hypothetical protein